MVDFALMVLDGAEGLWNLFLFAPKDVPLIIFGFGVASVSQHLPDAVGEVSLEGDAGTMNGSMSTGAGGSFRS